LSERLSDIFHLDDEDNQELIDGIHAVHPYPGRMHPLWARRLLAELPEGASVVDPFCGAGTVLVEARVAGLHARGNDINPVAVRLARLRVIPPPDPARLRVVARDCAAGSVKRRETPFSALAQGEKDFAPHVLATLIALRDEIENATKGASGTGPQAVAAQRLREGLIFSLSPLLDKFSARSDRAASKVSPETVCKHFVERADRWASYFEAMATYRYAEAERADARWLPWKPGTADAIITSPPYPGVFDYVASQARRAKWLGEAEELVTASEKKEIGRRSGPPLWADDMVIAVKQMARTLKPGGILFMVVGDGVARDGNAGNVAIFADDVLVNEAERQGLALTAMVSQTRPHFHRHSADAFGDRPRQEHLMAFRKV
jgi:SAM-dependent methyltransferase